MVGFACMAALWLLWIARRVRKHVLQAQDQRRDPHHRSARARARRLARRSPNRPEVLAFAVPDQRTARILAPSVPIASGPTSPGLTVNGTVPRSHSRFWPQPPAPCSEVVLVHRYIRAVRDRHRHDRSCRERQSLSDHPSPLPRTVRTRPWQRPRRNLRRSARSGQPSHSHDAPWRGPPRLRSRPVKFTVMILRGRLRLPAHRDRPDDMRRFFSDPGPLREAGFSLLF